MAKIVKAELVSEHHSDLLEGPIWHPDREEVFYSALLDGTVFAYSPGKDSVRTVSEGPLVGGSTIHEDGRLMLFQDGTVALMDPQTGAREQVAAGVSAPNGRFNDVIADPAGRVLAGTMDGGDGQLLRIELDGSVAVVHSGQPVPNGLGFSPDESKLYYTESLSHNIYRYDFDRATGGMSNRYVHVQIPKAAGMPDGMTMDREGFIWSAVWHSSEVRRFDLTGDPDGTVVVLPVSQPSSTVFGGAKMNEMYITTAGAEGGDSLGPNPRPHPEMPRGGGLYRATIDFTSGIEEYRSRVQF